MSAEIYKKYIENKSYEELHKTLRASTPGSDVYIQTAEEIRKIQQDTNNKQIGNLIDEIKELKTITDNNVKSSTNNAHTANRLSCVAITISIFSLIVAMISGYLTKKTLDVTVLGLQATIEPEIEIYWQHHQANTEMIDATTTVDLVLKNNFVGKIRKVEVFVSYLTFVQDKNNFNSMWICDWQRNTNPVASIEVLDAGKTSNFSFSMFDFYSKEGYSNTMREFANLDSIIRVRIKFIKDIGHSIEIRDFYYKVFDNRTLINYTDLELPSQIRTRYGAKNKNEIISLLQEVNTSAIDFRCFPNLFKKSKGL